MFSFDNRNLFDACKNGDCLLVNYLLLEKNIDVNDGLLGSCLGGHENLAQLMIDKGANDFDRGLHRACIGGHEHMVQMMIDNGAHEWEWGLEGACEGGHAHIAKMMIKRGAMCVNVGLLECINHNHRNLALLMVYYGADDWLCVLSKNDDKLILQILRLLSVARLQDFVSYIKLRLVRKRKCYFVNRHGVKAKDIFFYGIDNVDRQHDKQHNITEQFTCTDVANFMTRFVGLYPF